ncbi:hypothetical protein L1887_48410 [Cichorium endivia]|nr:hypothetical protein L1887_48410 [Cichorium endivia]
MLRAHLTEEADASVDSGPSPQLHPCIALSFVTAAMHPTRMRPARAPQIPQAELAATARHPYVDHALMLAYSIGRALDHRPLLPSLWGKTRSTRRPVPAFACRCTSSHSAFGRLDRFLISESERKSNRKGSSTASVTFRWPATNVAACCRTVSGGQ